MAVDNAGAEYTQTLADLNLQEQNTLATIGQEEGNLATNTGNEETSLTSQEPGVYQGEAKQAAKGGLFTSGANSFYGSSNQGNAGANGSIRIGAGRKAAIQENFAAKRTVNQAKLAQGKATDQKRREEAEKAGTLERGKAAKTRTAGEEAFNATYPTVPVGTAATPPPAGNVYVHEGGGVRVGPVGEPVPHPGAPMVHGIGGGPYTPVQKTASTRLQRMKAKGQI